MQIQQAVSFQEALDIIESIDIVRNRLIEGNRHAVIYGREDFTPAYLMKDTRMQQSDT
ncbi:MAG: hypothetical protein MAG551_02515 [Candidatus Scalindua arabica]|uniref:Uncharacterized protein n=1 Tax=Candidatus Scalindua arabica TaxID=1127984 RepID=A0A941W4S9_9BACT|nr:hypothetical protein [Candidatus Scalindua arabica]